MLLSQKTLLRNALKYLSKINKCCDLRSSQSPSVGPHCFRWPSESGGYTEINEHQADEAARGPALCLAPLRDGATPEDI